MSTLTVAAVAANFGRDLEDCFTRIEVLLRDARARGAALVVLPEAALGGYLADLDGSAGVSLPPVPWTSTARSCGGWPRSPATWW